MYNSYYNYGLGRAAYRRYGRNYYDMRLTFRELGGLLQVIIILFVIATAIISLPIILVVYIIQEHKKKKALELYNRSMQIMNDFDFSDNQQFANKVKDLVQYCTYYGYEFSSSFWEVSGSVELEAHYYQSVENVGIAVMRKMFGNEAKLGRAFVTNRELTPKAQEYCENAMIMVMDRNRILDMIAFRIVQEEKLAKRNK